MNRLIQKQERKGNSDNKLSKGILNAQHTGEDFLGKYIHV